MNYITFNGVASYDKGLIISGEGAFNGAELDETTQAIPGRNGTVSFWNGRWKNVEARYPALIVGDLAATAPAVRSWLLGQPGFLRLSDSYNPQEFRRARYIGGLDITPGFLNGNGEAELRFDCWPQRFLVSGETPQTIAASGDTLTNPTEFDALPEIVVVGSGDITMAVGGYVLQLSGLSGSVTIDCDAETAYDGGTNLNSILTLAQGFPKLGPGSNTITWSGTGSVTSVTVTPRWWRL